MKTCPECHIKVADADTCCAQCGAVLAPSSVAFGDEEGFYTDDVALELSDTYTILSGDSRKGILRVRQLASRADAINGNNRIYPRKVLNDAAMVAAPIALAGAMISEREHPHRVKNADGTPAYVDNPDRKTASTDVIHGVDAKGDLYIDRTILATKFGKEVADGFKAKTPLGVSMRFRATLVPKTLSDGRRVDVANYMEIYGFDDVDRPAVADTCRNFELLTDSLKEELGLPSVGIKDTKQMNKFKRALGALNLLIARKASPEEITKARQLCSDAITEMSTADEDISEATQLLTKCDSCCAIAGYTAKPGPMGVTFARITGIAGAAPDMEANAEPVTPNDPGTQSEPPVNGVLAKADNQKALTEGLASLGITPEMVTGMKAKDEADRKATAEAARVLAVDSVINGDDAYGKLSDKEKSIVRTNVLAMAQDVATAPAILTAQIDSISQITADAKLNAAGHHNGTGQTVTDPSNPASKEALVIKDRPTAMMAEVEKILAACDASSSLNPQNASRLPEERKKLRAHNREKMQPILADIQSVWNRSRNGEQLAAAIDSVMGDGDPTKISQALGDSITNVSAHYDSTSLNQMYNQPTIAMALLIQQFQDLEMFQWASGIGPTAPSANRGGWESQGFNGGEFAVLRMPSEYYSYNDPQGYGQFAGNQYDAGFIVPENTGIPEISVLTSWQPFAPQWRRIAAAATRDVIKAMGHGPLNYDVIGRHLYHMTFAKNRAVDKAIGDNMLQVSDEYGAIAVSGESVTLANNSVYNAGGSIKVNLNPTKIASATIATTTDAAVQYGSNVVAAVRLLSTATGAYFGSSIWGSTPIVQPRVIVDFTAAGQITNTTINPITVTAPANQVQGYLDSTFSIQTLPGGGSAATFAVDYQNGVVVFKTGGGVSGSSGIATTAVTVSYTYATNFDAFNAITNVAASLASGQTLDDYYNGILTQHDATAAIMGSAPRFVKPNLALMSLTASQYITRAKLFYKLNSPDGTDLFPTENYFYQRTGIRGGRHNTPWYGGDKRILLTQEGATKYAIDTPLEARGPYPKYDANGKIIATDLYYMEENSVICTPQVQDQNANVLNPINRSVLLY